MHLPAGSDSPCAAPAAFALAAARGDDGAELDSVAVATAAAAVSVASFSAVAAAAFSAAALSAAAAFFRCSAYNVMRLKDAC